MSGMHCPNHSENLIAPTVNLIGSSVTSSLQAFRAGRFVTLTMTCDVLQREKGDDDDDERQVQWHMDAFFLPMRDPFSEHQNTPLLEYFGWGLLESAPVSTAARKFVRNLENMGIPPNEWRDMHARPLLTVAAQWNYRRLFKWLVSKGCSLKHNRLGANLLHDVQSAGFKKLAQYISDQLNDK
jgi:hypothetical protein